MPECLHAHPCMPRQVRPGCVTVLAGAPNAGKSEFADALLCNLAELHGLKVAICSLERKVCAASCANNLRSALMLKYIHPELQ